MSKASKILPGRIRQAPGQPVEAVFHRLQSLALRDLEERPVYHCRMVFRCMVFEIGPEGDRVRVCTHGK